MPKLDGIEAIKRIRTGNGISSRSKICILTAHINAADNIRSSQAGADGAYAKPLSRSVLRTLLADTDTPANMITTHQQRIVDSHVMDQLQATLASSEIHLLMKRFFSEGEQFISNICHSNTLSQTELTSSIHKFAGTAATFGATILHRKLSDAENAILSEDNENLKTVLQDIPALWHQTKDELEQFQAAA